MKILKESHRLLLTMFLAVIGTFFALAQTETIIHTVARGETLESIAKQYSTNVQSIIDLNPEAAQFVYVGMSLKIPASKSASSYRGDSSNNQTSYSGNQTNYSGSPVITSYNSDVSDEHKLSYIADFAFGFLPNVKYNDGKNRTTTFNYAYSATFGVNYYVYKDAYAGARIGYNSANYSNFSVAEGNTARVESSYHFISIPLELGYKIGGKYALIPHVGFDLNMCVAAKSKTKISNDTYESKVKKPFSTDFNLGIRLDISDFCINGAYHIPLSGKEAFGDEGYFSVGIGFLVDK